MNHIYRSIWNESTATYVAAAETSKSGGKKALSSTGSLHGGRGAPRALVAAMCVAYATGAWALPQDGVVTTGSASVTATPGKLTIVQGSQRAVLDWQSFGIGVGEAVQFVQPNASAVALNRVVGPDPSAILGSLSANGKVFLVNPNGILFGRGASVNVGGLVASTLDITDTDFMAGRYKFSGNSSNAVSNQGTINAPGGYVAMLGANVSNEGVIAARMGSVALAGGQAITLDVAGDGLLNITIDQGAVNALVSNGGLIQADGGQVLMTAQAAGKLLNTVVNNAGVIQAQTLVNHNGTIKLLGDMQTGTVNAGGTLDASAPAAGNGGFIETSAAHVKIADALKVTTAASAHGLTGSWLIDPTDYTIAATGGDQTGAFYSNALQTSNVSIQSISGGSGVSGDIHVNDPIAWSANKLTLTAQNSININKPLTGTGTASLALEHGQGAVASSNASQITIKAEVNLPSGNSFSTKQGSDGTTKIYTMINSLGAAGSTTGTDLQGMRGGMSGNYALGSNIDASATANTAIWGANGFVAIGTNTTPFTGQFEGLGHTISGLTSGISTSNLSAALFGTVTTAAQIRNVGMLDVSMRSSVPGSGSYGNAAGLVGSNAGLVNNAHVTGSVSTPGYAYIGGLVGKNSGTILNSSSGATISVTNATLDTVIGGLVGLATKASKITSSYNTGAVTATSKHTGGGLVGINYGAITNSFNTGAVAVGIDAGGLVASNRSSGALINNSFSTGAVSGSGHVGGLVGWTTSSSQINNSYATGTVTGLGLGGLASAAVSTGGLVGNNRSSITNSYATGAVTGATSSVGGVVGANGTSTSAGSVTNVYSSGTATLTGTVAGTTVAGGVIGFNNATATITGGYFNSTINTVSAIGGGTGAVTSVSGLSATQMRTGASFGTFNFTTTSGQSGNNWVMVNTDGTLNGAGNATSATGPMLSSEYSTTIRSSHQLQLMAMNLAGQYTLGRDINAASTGGATDVWNGGTFVPVGASTATPFTGTLEGAGHVISGLVLNRPGIDQSGLFGATSNTAVIRDVGLEGGSVNGATDTGALVGNHAGTVSGSYSTMGVTGTANTGGLVGNNSGTVSNSYASGTVSGTNTVGGLAGVNSGTLTHNYAAGPVTGGANVGGLVGGNIGSGSGNFWDTTTSGTNSSAIGTGLATAQMKSLATYAVPGWDMGSTWTLYDTHTNPLLCAFMTPVLVNLALNNSKTYDGTSSFTASGVTSSIPSAYGALLGTLTTDAAGNAVNAGTYAVTAGGLYSGQRGYLISYNAASLTIDPKAVTLTGASVTTRAYDGSTTATLSGGSLSGLVTGETVTVGSSTAVFTDKNAGTAKGVTVTAVGLVDGTGLASNYTVGLPTGLTGTVTAKALGWNGLTVDNKVYDGNTAASISGGSISGLVGGETLTAAPGAAFLDKNAGTGKTVHVGTTLGDGGNGGLAANYTLADATTTANITKATISTVSGITALDKVYDGNTKASLNATGATFNGMVSGDSLSLSATSATFADKNAGSGKTVAISGIALGGTDAGNYDLSTSTGSATGVITPKALTIIGMSAVNKVYDGNTKASVTGGSISGLVGSETLGVTGLTVTFADKNAGTAKAVTATGTTLVNGGNGGLAANYTMSNPTGFTANITPKALTVSGMAAGTKVYDGSTSASLAGGSLSGLISGESLVLSGGSGVFADPNAGTGKAVIVSGVSLADGSGLASNYTVNNPTTVTGTITQKALTITGMMAGNKVYDGNAVAALAGGALSGLVGSETLGLAGSTGAFDTANAGNGKSVTVTAALSDGTGLAANYSVANPMGLTANVTPKALTIAGMMATNKVYDGDVVAQLSGSTLSGLVGAETLVLSGLSGVFGDKNVGTGKTVTVSGAALSDGSNGGLASNYTVASPGSVSADITKATISTVSGITALDKVYDANTQATLNLTGATFNGMVGGDSLSFSATTAAFADKNVGSGKTVAVSGIALGGTDAGNYDLSTSTSSGMANITPKALTIVGMTAVNKVYDGSTKATLSGGSISGLVGTETLGVTGLTASFSDKNAGAGKAVTASGSTLVNGGNGGLASNYTISNPTGLIANITPKALTVSGMTAGTKIYDGGTSASLAGGSLSGLISGEALVLSGGSGVFADPNAGAGKAVIVSGVSLADGSGLASNYTVTNPTTVTGTITQKALTITGMVAGNKVYDGNAVAALAGGALSGLVGSETLGLAGSTGAFDTANAGNGKAVTVAAALSDGTGLAANYSVANPTGLTANVTPKALTITGTMAANKVYDGDVVAQLNGATLSGVVGAETLGLSGLIGVFDDKNAGTGKTVTVSGASLSDGSNGGLASNYTVASPGSVSADITRATISTVSGITALDKVYDGNTQASLHATGANFNGMVNGDSLSFSATTATFADKNAGSGKTVAISGIALGGTDAGNYDLSTSTSSGMANITPKGLTIVGMAAVNKVYDGSTKATLTGGSISGLVGSETLGVTGSTAAFSDKNVGTAKTVTATGSTLVNGGNGGLAANYTVSNPIGLIANITPKTLTVSGMTAGTRAYDATTAVTLSGGALGGLIGGETLILSGSSGVFADKNAGTGKSVIVSGSTLADGTGLASNYTVSDPTGLVADVTPRALTVTGVTAGNKVYDGNVVAALSGGSLSGLVGSETLGLSGLAGTFSDKNAANGKTVTVTGAALFDGTGLASNYTVSNPGALTANISKANIGSVGGITAGNKVYDGTTVASLDTAGASFSGMVAGDSLSASATAGAFGDKNVATGKAVSVSGIALGGTDAGNYSLASTTASTTADITAKALTIAGMTADNKVFDGTTVASLRGGTLAGLVGGETLGLTGSTGAFDSPSIGSGKAVAVSGSTLSDGSGLASNYSVSNPTGLQADITPAAVPAAATSPVVRPTSGNVVSSASGSSSPSVETGFGNDALSERDFSSDGKARPTRQAGTRAPLSLSALGFTMTGNGIRLPAGVVPASQGADD